MTSSAGVMSFLQVYIFLAGYEILTKPCFPYLIKPNFRAKVKETPFKLQAML
jgi:hypothetical protein